MESTPVNFTTLEIIQTWPPRLPYHIILWSQHLSNSQHQRLYKHDHRGSRITLYYGVNTCQTHNIRDYTYMITEAPVSHYIMESTPVNFTTLEIIQTWPPRLPYHIILWSQHLQTHNIIIQTWPPRLPYHIILWSQHLSNSQHQRLYIHDHRGSRITLYYGVNTSQLQNLRNHTNMTTEAPVSHYIMESTPVKLTTSKTIHTWPPRLPYHIILWSQHQSTSQP